MARRAQLTLLSNAGAGAGAGVDWPGGNGLFMVDATFGGGSVALEQLSPSGKWLPLVNLATTTAISLTANGVANFLAPAGQIRANATTATAVNAYAIGVPQNVAG
ncbi:hypothetical protein AWB71_03301 [Caballeronia peredens]|nr:hypothetical protein AWB71_03301 [Caballeronia peredens]